MFGCNRTDMFAIHSSLLFRSFVWRSSLSQSSHFEFEAAKSLLVSCGRIVRNNTLTEVLVFHQTLSTPKASYSGRYPSDTPQVRTRKIHIFPKDPIMKTSYNTCPFHTSEFLKKYIITLPNVIVWNNKQQNLK